MRLATGSWVAEMGELPALVLVALATWVALPGVMLMVTWFWGWLGVTALLLVLILGSGVAVRGMRGVDAEGDAAGPGDTTVGIGGGSEESGGGPQSPPGGELLPGEVRTGRGEHVAGGAGPSGGREGVSGARSPAHSVPSEPPTTEPASAIPLAVSLRGEEAALRAGLGGRLSAPFEEELAVGATAQRTLVVTLTSEHLPPVYGQHQATVTLTWRWINTVSGTELGTGQVVNLMANGRTPDAARSRALQVALDTMVARLRRSGIVPE